MDTVIMKGLGQTSETEFNIDHAQRILDFEKLNPPATWKMIDPDYNIVQADDSK